MGTRIKNNEITLALGAATKCDLNSDILPNELEPKIQSVIDVTPNMNESCDVVVASPKSTTGTTTLYTTPSNKDFYLTGAWLSYTKDATCDTATGALPITATLNGVAIQFLTLSKLTLTAEQRQISITFETPIKIDRNTIISFGTTWSVGNMIIAVGITGYTQDPVIYNINP